MQGFREMDLMDLGKWVESSAAGSVWRLQMESPGAQSHVLIFR